MTSPNHRIFISHSHLDNDFGTRLAQDLRRLLKDESAVFYDVLGGLHGGDIWWEKIVEELTARNVFLLVLSPDSMNSIWVRREINVALNEGKYILPVLHRACTVRADLKILQIISFLAPKAYETAFREVLIALDLPLETPLEPQERPDQPGDPASRIIQQMEAAFAEHDWPDVIRKANYLIKHMPESISSTVYRWQGLALLEEGEVQQAQEALETALALVSNRELRLTLLSDYTGLLVRQEQWARVLQQAREALRLVPNDPAWLATRQQAQSQLSKHAPVPAASQEQIPTVDQKTSPKPQESKTPPQKTKEEWMDDGNTLYGLKRYEEALTAYVQAIRLDPNYAQANYGKGIALRKLKRYDEALAAYDQALRLAPTYAFAYHSKGNALRDLKRYDEALAAFEQALRLDSNFALAYNSKGAVLYDLKRYEEALAEYNQAIHLDPNGAIPYCNKGEVLNNLKRYEEAIVASDQALHLDPNLAEAYNNKGLALERLGRRREAQQAYEKARQLGYSS